MTAAGRGEIAPAGRPLRLGGARPARRSGVEARGRWCGPTPCSSRKSRQRRGSRQWSRTRSLVVACGRGSGRAGPGRPGPGRCRRRSRSRRRGPARCRASRTACSRRSSPSPVRGADRRRTRRGGPGARPGTSGRGRGRPCSGPGSSGGRRRPSSSSTALTASICSSASGLEASTTCSSRSAWRASSSVALNEATSECGRFADEADGVGEQDVAAAAELPAPGPGVEGGEELVLDEHAGVGQGVHQGALAGVGVADERDGRHVAAAGDLALLAGLDLGELGLEVLDAVVDQPAVLFELLLAGAADADAALVARQVGPHPLEPGQRVFELRQLDLEVGLVGPGVGGEDVEDDLGAVDDLDAERLLQVARLGRARGRCRRRRGRPRGPRPAP